MSTAGGERMRIAASGNIGIGTNSPNVPLHVYGSSAAGGVPTYIQNAATDGFAQLWFFSGSSSGGLFLNGQSRSTDGGVSTLTMRNDAGNLRLSASGNSPTIFLQNSTGCVGIGTDSLGYYLDIYGSSYTLLRLNSPSSDTVMDFYNSRAGANNYRVAIGSSTSGIPSAFYIYNITTGGRPLTIGNNSDVTMGTNLLFNSNGYGITSPQQGANDYGNICTYAAGRNGWSGYGMTSRHVIMSNGTEVGIHDNTLSWCIKFDTNKSCNIYGALTVNGLLVNTANIGSANVYAVGVAANGVGNFAGGTGAGTYIQWFYGITYCASFSNSILVYGAVFAQSDKRVKKNIIPIQNSLDTIRKLKPVSFQFIDEVKYGSVIQHGFIAQDVKEINDSLTESSNKDYIPNIYDYGTIQGKIITLNNKTFTMEMKRIKLYHTTDSIEVNIEVLSTTTCKLENNVSFTECFVYGSYVEDIQSIKKDEIFSIGIAAIQEIDQKQVALEEKIVSLESRVVSLESQLAQVLQRLAAASIP
jgi:hypothetical protein